MAKLLTKAMAAALMLTLGGGGTAVLAQTSLSVKNDRSKMKASSVSLRPQVAPTKAMISSKGNQADAKAQASEMQKVPCTLAGRGTSPLRAASDATYYNNFDDPESFLIFNENGDDQQWLIGIPSGGDGENSCAFINYNGSVAMDDWMLTEGIQLEGGKAYDVSLDMWTNGYTEKIEIFAGTTRTPDGMTIEVVPVVTHAGSTIKVCTGTFVPPATGIYYIGIHGCSDADQYVLYVDNLEVSAPMSADMPDKAVDLTVVQKEGEDGVATINFKAPSVRFNGQPLNTLNKIEVLRGSNVIAEYTNPSLGQEFTLDDICGNGKFTWTVLSYNDEGVSQPATATISVVGTVEIPYHKEFPTADSMDEMVIIDADGDGATWGWNQYQKYAELSTTGQSSDDWLISVPINLKAGKMYDFYSLISAGNPSAFAPKIAIYVGNAPTVDAMNITVVPPTQITKYDTYFNESFSVPADGKYYVGFHGCSTEWLALIKLMYFDVKGGAELDGPSAPMDVVVTPDYTGRTNVTEFTFTAPVTTNRGDALNAITNIDIERNGVAVKTFENPTPGTEYTYTDTAPGSGTYMYSIVPYNEAGLGAKYETTVALGVRGKSVPYLEDFSSEARFDDELTFIDYNDDGTCFWHATATTPPYAWVHSGDGTPTSDDWLITPAIYLDANTKYYFSADAWGFKEGMELRAGSAPNVEGLTEVVVPWVELNGDQTTYGNEFTSTYAGNYFFAVRALAENRIDDFHVTNISVTKIGALSSPAKIENLKFVPNGEQSLDISFNAPAKTVGGDDLNEISSIEVRRWGMTFKTIENPAPGEAISFTDTPEYGGEIVDGEIVYNFVPILNDVEGQYVNHVAFVGEDLPAQPQNVVAEYLGNGKVKVTWDPVTTTEHGVSVDAKSYIILEVDSNGKEKQITATTDTEYTYDALDPEDQKLLHYGIFPVNASSQVGEYGYSNGVYAGTPYKMSYRESFADGAFSSVINITPIIFAGEWYLCTNSTFSDVKPSDGDNGYVAMRGVMGTSGRLETGMIDLSTNAVSPTLSFNVYVIDPSVYDNELYVDVCEVGTDNWTEIFGGPIANFNDVAGWTRIQVDLAAYKGKNIMVALRPVGKTYFYTIMDAIRVSNLTSNDAGVSATCDDADVNAGDGTNIDFMVTNNGQDEIPALSVELYKNGELAGTKNIKNLASGDAKSGLFKQSFTVADTDVVEYYVKVVNEGDEYEGDNVSKTIKVNVVKPIYPVVQNLTATVNKADVTLTWDAPSMENVAPAPFTETFEAAESWSQTGVCGWTFVDRDGAPTGGFQQFDFPGIVNGETVLSYFVIDSTTDLDGYEVLFKGADDSDKSIGALLTYTGAACDDWAISPELYGGRQTAYFSVKALLEANPETFECYYSTGSTDPDDFIKIGQTMSYNQDWVEIASYLPEGAKRFAIRHVSTSGALMMLDNITLRLAGAEPENLALVGYNVYCDGERVNNGPIEETTYSETNPVDGEHRYSVSAVYEEGESNTVNANATVSGVAEVAAEAMSVTGGKGIVVIRGAEGQELLITAADGKVIFSGMGENHMQVAAETGVCVVKAGNRTFKVIVK